MGEILLVRHGETAWSRDGRHTGGTDVPLTPYGETQARALSTQLAGRHFALALASPLVRAWRTAELAGLAQLSDEGPRRDDDLREWDYGAYEGRTTADIQAERPDWYLWADGVVGGERVDDVGMRADRVLTRARAASAEGDVVLVAHGHLLRVMGARWIGLAAAYGGCLALDRASTCRLGSEHDRPVLTEWNMPAPPFGSGRS